MLADARARCIRIAGLLAGVAAVLVIGVGARAEKPATPLVQYAGEYRFAGTRAEGVAIIEKAMDDALSDLNTVMRLMAKKAMTQYFAEVIVIETPPGKLGLKVGDFEKITTELGKSKTVQNPGGMGTSEVMYGFDRGAIREVVKSSMDTTITTISRLSDDNKALLRDVTVQGSRLPKPIKYRLTYLRK
jgi:hypothetical protein